MKTLNLFLLVFILMLSANCAAVERGNANAAPETAIVGNAATNEMTNAAVAAATPQTTTPDALVKDLYKQHDSKKSPFFQTKNRALVDRYFVKSLADMIWKDANDSKGEVGALDGDPLYDAQDMDIKKFTVGAAEIKGDVASVPVSFENFGKKQTLRFELARQNGDWKIADIKYSGGYTLTGFFKDSAPENATGEFDGTYQVGATTCVVKPVKMAFEVRWAKGAGAMMFFADEQADSFVSEDTGKGKDRFVFDDDNLTTGKFIRADGKEMPVRKIK